MSVLLQQRGNLRYELRRKRAAGERHNLDDLDAALAGRYTRQRDAAIFARGVGCQQKVRHFVIL